MGKGKLRIELRTAQSALPINNCMITVREENGRIQTQEITPPDEGVSREFVIDAPEISLSLSPSSASLPFSTCDVMFDSSRYYQMTIAGVQIFDTILSVINVDLIPLPLSIPDSSQDAPRSVVIPTHHLSSGSGEPIIRRPSPASVAKGNTVPAVNILEGVFIPSTITVHLGDPDDDDAENVTVSFVDYIKNVASSEIFPTWPEQSLRANIIAQISLALNRIYTEWYPSRGHNFDITNDTSVDQYFVYGRNIFENISLIVDDIFNTYLTQRFSIEPYFAEYCNGTTSVCAGMSQWGTVSLAESGLTYEDILSFYYGDVVVTTTDRIQDATESYPGTPVERGDSNEYVRIIQEQLNRIAVNYPAIPLNRVSGVYDQLTIDAVEKFRSVFLLGTGEDVDKAVWYRLSSIYTSVKKLAQLTSEGQRASYSDKLYPGRPLTSGSVGSEVQEVQYYLKIISQYYQAVRNTIVDGIYGSGTANSVSSFQREQGIPVTGVVDETTWNKIIDVYIGIDDNVDVPIFVEETKDYPGYIVSPGARGNDVIYAQELLNVINDIFPLVTRVVEDGIYGENTAASVRRFQTLFGLDPTGDINQGTWDKLNLIYVSVASRCIFATPESTGNRPYPGEPLQKGSRGDNVTYIQRRSNLLYTALPYVGTVVEDGIFGEATEQAVMAAERAFGLTPNGLVGEVTWRLYNYLYVAIQTGCLPSDRSATVMSTMMSSVTSTVSVPKHTPSEVKKAIREYFRKKHGADVRLGMSDNIYGPFTRNAVRIIQGENGLEKTGELDAQTVTLLFG